MKTYLGTGSSCPAGITLAQLRCILSVECWKQPNPAGRVPHFRVHIGNLMRCLPQHQWGASIGSSMGTPEAGAGTAPAGVGCEWEGPALPEMTPFLERLGWVSVCEG